jgi:hypothetical protein
MKGCSGGQAGGVETLQAENTFLLKLVVLRRAEAAVNASKVALLAPASAPGLKALCEKIRRKASLTPPSIIDALCDGMPLPWVYVEAVFVEELREIARILNRDRLLKFVKCVSE